MSDSTTSIPKAKIYTRTGDKGQSTLLDGKRHPKTELQFDAIGDVDECNSAIAIANEYCQDIDVELSNKLAEIESWLFDVGAVLANPISTQEIPNSLKDTIKTVEKWIDLLDSELKPLNSFILPSGGKAAAHLHMARSICRRAERTVIKLNGEEKCPSFVSPILNRVNDFLFVAARYASMKQGKEEITKKF